MKQRETPSAVRPRFRIRSPEEAPSWWAKADADMRERHRAVVARLEGADREEYEQVRQRRPLWVCDNSGAGALRAFYPVETGDDELTLAAAVEMEPGSTHEGFLLVAETDFAPPYHAWSEEAYPTLLEACVVGADRDYDGMTRYVIEDELDEAA